jgi:hypothetical protein
VLRNPDHVTIAVADGPGAIEFFAPLGFRKDHVTTIDGGEPARYIPEGITLELVEWVSS